MDADMIAIRAPDELFDIPHAFSAAPDIGWPDIFNTGLMVLSPNMGDYYALLAMAQRGISFDGADQGLLNMHFRTTYNRLSFTYNVTPSAHYQYLPAYRHFQSSISMGHFIGPTKPWTQGREANRGSTPYDEMVGRWWAVYDRHYRESVCRSRPCVAVILTSSKSVQPAAEPSAPLVQYHVKGEFHPVCPIISSSKASQSEGIVSEILLPATEEPLHETTEIVEEAKVVEQVEAVPALPVQSIPQKEEEREPQYSSWDASKSVIVTSLNLK